MTQRMRSTRRLSHVVGITTLLLLYLGASISAWEADVHYGLTKWLAIKAGFTPAEAEQIAKGDQWVDDSRVTGPIQATLLSCQDDPKGANDVHDNHFPSFEIAPNSPNVRTVKAGQIFSRKQPRPLPPSGRSNADLLLLGDYLHALQDSWSHDGEPDMPPMCDAQYGWGHALKRGSWACHLADLTYPWETQTLTQVQTMAKATFDAMSQFLGKPAAAWTLGANVRDFAVASSKQSKDKWFASLMTSASAGVPPRQIFPNRDFLQGLSLPDCDSATPCTPYPIARLISDFRQRPIGGGVAGLGRDVVGLFRRFFTAILEGQYDALMSTVDQALAERALARSLNMSEQCPQLFKTWLTIMLLDGFREGWGAQQPPALCELIAARNTSGPGKALSCSEAIAEAQKVANSKIRRAPRLDEAQAMLDKEAPQADRPVPPYDFSAFRGPDNSYFAVARFVHYPNDLLVVTANATSITSFTWMPRR